MALCSHCAEVWAWKPPSRVDDWEYDERWNNDPDSAYAHHSYKHCPSFAALEASARGGCNLCQLLCYDISMFPIREYRSMYKFDNWPLLAENVEQFLRSWTESTEVVLSLFNRKGQSGYGVYYWIGDTGVTGALPFGSTIAFQNLIRYPEKRWTQVAKWLQKCEEHVGCAVSDESYVPSRIIDVGTKEGSGKLRLVETIEHRLPGMTSTQSKYIALSYCWGQSMPSGGMTTTSSRASHLKDIPIDLLPLTLRDAVIITRALGIQYLWIDALCIIQDDNQDWQRESGAMVRIYSSAYLTIAAASTTHCNGGILNKQDRRQLLIVPLKNISLKANTPTHRDQRESSPLSRRAWALQERELSPRILWFFKHMLGFECRKLWASEAEPRGQGHLFDDSGVRDRSLHIMMGLRQGREGPDTPSLLRPSDHGEVYLSWRTTVEEYSSRELTRPSDKLPALSGLAHMVQAAVGSEYAAGLWVNDFLRGLLWRTLRPNSTTLSRVQSRAAAGGESSPNLLVPLRRLSNYLYDLVATSTSHNPNSMESSTVVEDAEPSRYIAPSWSWASVKGPIDYRVALPSRYVDPAESGKSLNAIIVSIHMKPLGSDPLGEVASGCVILVGWVRSLRDWLAKPREFWSDELARWDNDSEETEGVMILGLMRHDSFLEDVPAYNGLLIKDKDKTGEYVRVGLIKAVHASWLGEVQKKEILLL